MRESHLPLLLILFALAGTCTVQIAQGQTPCSAPEHRQFDFWLGAWDVRDAAGQPAGASRIESILGGCAVQETWEGPGMHGTSLNAYDAPRRLWHQTWMDDQGRVARLEGGLEDGKMVLRGEVASRRESGKTVLTRLTWTPLPNGQVRQHWEVSRDQGATWTTMFDGYYQRKASS